MCSWFHLQFLHLQLFFDKLHTLLFKLLQPWHVSRGVSRGVHSDANRGVHRDVNTGVKTGVSAGVNTGVNGVF